MGNLNDRLDEINNKRQEFEIEEQMLIEEGLQSTDPSEVIKAMNVVKIRGNEGIKDRKAVFIDPEDFYNSFGYKSRPTKMSYDMLTAMSRQPIINAIIKTRKNQIATFSQPQKDRFSAGFVIKKKGTRKAGEKLSHEDIERIDEVTEFILNTGEHSSWSRDDFNTFLRKIIGDSLTYDQMCFEIVRSRGGGLHEFLAVDATTIRIAESYDDQSWQERKGELDPMGKPLKEIGGYYPSYVQVIDDNTQANAEFYPWEMCFGVRNPTTRLWGNGYGRSELEDLVAVVTSMLWSDQYNRNFFKVGASPKGMIRIKGGGNNARLTEFKQQWKAMVAGVANSWKTPVIDSESMDWIDLQKTSRDMEFSKWQEYLIKLSCALYTIDPSEVGFASGSASDSKPMFESNNASKIKYSKDKGLAPLLRFVESQINKYIVSQIYPDLTFEFVGLNAETEQEFMTKLKDEVTNWKTINEIRAEMELKPLAKGGDIVLNTVYTTNLQQEAMAQQMEEQEGEMDAEMGEQSPSDVAFGDEEQDTETTDTEEVTDVNPNEKVSEETEFNEDEQEANENPFTKAFDDMINDLQRGTL